MHLSLIAATIVVAPGCGLESFLGGSKSTGKSETHDGSAAASASEALVTFNGKTLISKEQFNDRLNQILKAQGAVNMTAEQIPAQFKMGMLDQQISVAVVRESWGSAQGIEEQEEFKKKLEMQIENIKEALVFDMYLKSLKENVKQSDSELEAAAKSDYEKNKKQYCKDPGGVSVKAVSFSSHEKAQAFYEKARNGDFEKLASKEVTGKVRNFDRVDEDDNMAGAYKAQAPQAPAKIRQAALSGSKFPRVEIVQDAKETSVIYVTRKEPVYHDFNEIKPQLKRKVEGESWNEFVVKGIEQLKASGKLEIRKELLESAAPAHGHEHAAAAGNDEMPGLEEVEPAA